MKLNELYQARTSDFLMEDYEKLANLRLMISKQGKDPEPIISRIRGMIEPDYAKREGHKATLKRWVEAAHRGEEKIGRAYGKKVKVTVLESVIMTENIFKDVGGLIVKKLSKIIGSEREENKLVSKVLDATPELAALIRYTNQATKAGKSIYSDPKFWELTNKLTGGRGEEIKRLAQTIFKRLIEEAKSNKLRMLSECVVFEAKISELITGLGVPQEAAVDLMSKYGIKDEVSAERSERAEPNSALQQKQYDKYDLDEENTEFADLVILLTAALQKAKEANTPEEKAAAIQSVLPTAGGTIPGSPADEVLSSELHSY